MYVIVKHIKNEKTGKRLPVILIDSQSEILEFEEKKEAENLCNILNSNTDSGHVYTVKEV
jgi:archaellum biogenesis ATPase FlaH